MSNKPPLLSPVPCIEAAVQDLDLNTKIRAPDSESNRGVNPSFETLMKELACKIQGEHQEVRHFATQIEAAVITICQKYPQWLDEDAVVELKRERFYHGLKRVYRESFIHLYEEKESFEKILYAVLIAEKTFKDLEKSPLNLSEDHNSSSKEKPARRPRHQRKHSCE